MKQMTKKQMEVYNFICGRIEEQGFPPTVREIGEFFEISVKGAYDHLKAIERKGFIRCSSSKSRAIEVMKSHGVSPMRSVPLAAKDLVRVPLVGMTTAGMPALAEQNIEEEYYLPKSLVGNEQVFALRVRGDSMINAGIHDGDLALIRVQAVADNGDIVVALLGEEATIKRFYRDGALIRLQPENPEYQPIMVEDASILGKVVWVFRKIS